MFSLRDIWPQDSAGRLARLNKQRIPQLKLTFSAVEPQLATFLDEKGFRIMFTRRAEEYKANAYLSGKSVHMNPKSDRMLQPIFLGHEARHGWQDAMGLTYYRMMNVADAIVHIRFNEADSFSLEAEMAWNLRARGDDKIWQRYKKEEPALAAMFERVASGDPDSLQNGQARWSTFNEWFRTPHKDSYDEKTLDDIERQCKAVAAGKRAYVISDKKRPEGAPPKMSVEYLREFGERSWGDNYLARANTHGSLYAGNISPRNLRRIEKLTTQYPFLQTEGVAASIPVPS